MQTFDQHLDPNPDLGPESGNFFKPVGSNYVSARRNPVGAALFPLCQLWAAFHPTPHLFSALLPGSAPAPPVTPSPAKEKKTGMLSTGTALRVFRWSSAFWKGAKAPSAVPPHLCRLLGMGKRQEWAGA
uniref:Uncharacterized protein n=1 Tax=Eutreptiella gymnastica TaxID=73025 RepID=A0A7S1IRN7_9EUGL|mmetsp:Transcript_38093/g.68046  ORF Transcript_38093/g.68046 Transcript_38093/m.68046 type:complete len:129 (+) Transcript_38093:513-899(+)